MTSGKAVVQTQDSLSPEPALLTAAVSFLPFPGAQNASCLWFWGFWQLSGSLEGISVDRHVAIQWSQLTAALPCSRPWLRSIIAALAGCSVADEWRDASDERSRLTNPYQRMQVGDPEERKGGQQKKLLWVSFSESGWVACSLLSFHDDACQHFPTKAFPNVMILVTTFTSVCDLQSTFYCAVLFRLYHIPMRRGEIKIKSLSYYPGSQS